MITMPLLASAAVEARALYSFPILIVSNESTHPACDQCRKTKSKCERPSGDATQCKSCALAGTREYSYPPTLLYYTQFPYIPACTFLGMQILFTRPRILSYLVQGPSYKRGPPKGYIHAIEQRWHQVESLLGAILQCPDARVQEFVNDLKQDELAREIIDRVDMGPYVSKIISTR